MTDSVSAYLAREEAKDARAAEARARNRRLAAQHAHAIAAPRARRLEASRQALAFTGGERATDEHIAKTGADVIALSSIDPRQRGRVTRMSDGWRPRTLYERGRLTKRQYGAALALCDLYDRAGFARIKGQSWREPVDGASGASGADAQSAARRRYVGLMKRLPDALRIVLERVVIEGRGVSDAVSDAAFDRDAACWMPASRSERMAAGGVLLAAGLDSVALMLGV